MKDFKILDALNVIDPSELSYEEWLEVGMGLKAEGFDVEVFDEWSQRDTKRYHPGECESKYATFNSDGVTGGTIMHLAVDRFNYNTDRVLDWDDGLSASSMEEPEDYVSDLDQMRADMASVEPWEQAILYLETLFDPDDLVSYVHEAKFDDVREKYLPANGGVTRRCADIIEDLKNYKDLDSAFGTIDHDAGAWIRFNPVDGHGVGDKNITDYRYALVESDTLELQDQVRLLEAIKLPIAALLESGGKSVHAIVRVNAKSDIEYKQKVAFLYDVLAQRGFIVDTNNKNASRLSRLPGATRKERTQTLLAVNIGSKSWDEWIDELEGITDTLPEISSFADMMKNPPETREELIAGILKVGSKMIITGDSKSGKTCMMQELAVCIAEGKPWLKTYQCKQGRVLYLNFEVHEESMFKRFKLLYEKMLPGEKDLHFENLDIWNLRGFAAPLEELTGKIIRRCRNGSYVAIILDPIYKIQMSGDENNASDIAKFCNSLDKIATETGAAVLYCHHHPKGLMGSRKAIDRGAGSGVFARDPDAIIDMSAIEVNKELASSLFDLGISHMMPLKMSFNLRDFKSPNDVNIFFDFPLHRMDTKGYLDGTYVEGSAEANLSKSSKRTSKDKRRETLVALFDRYVTEDGWANLKDLYTDPDSPTRKTLYAYIDEQPDFETRDGKVYYVGDDDEVKNDD